MDTKLYARKLVMKIGNVTLYTRFYVSNKSFSWKTRCQSMLAQICLNIWDCMEPLFRIRSPNVLNGTVNCKHKSLQIYILFDQFKCIVAVPILNIEWSAIVTYNRATICILIISLDKVSFQDTRCNFLSKCLMHFKPFYIIDDITTAICSFDGACALNPIVVFSSILCLWHWK